MVWDRLRAGLAADQAASADLRDGNRVAAAVSVDLPDGSRAAAADMAAAASVVDHLDGNRAAVVDMAAAVRPDGSRVAVAETDGGKLEPRPIRSAHSHPAFINIYC